MARSTATDRNSLPIGYIPSGRLIYDFSTTDNLIGLGTNSLIELATDYVRYGSQSLRMKSNDQSGMYLTTGDLNYSGPFENEMWVSALIYIPDYTLVEQVEVFIYNGASFDRYHYTIAGSDNIGRQRNGWHWASFSVLFSGNVDWTPRITIIQMRIQTAGSATGVEWWVDSIWAECRPKPICIFTFDDGFAGSFSLGLPMLEANGWLGSAGVIGDSVDAGAPFASKAEIQAAYDAGHDVHAHGQTNLTTLSAVEAAADVQANIDYCVGNGWTRAINCYAYPNGARTAAICNMLQQKGITTTRQATTNGHIVFAAGDADHDVLLELKNINVRASDFNLAAIMASVDAAIVDGGVICLEMHDVSASGATGSDVDGADLQSVVDAVKTREDKGLLSVMSWSSWYNGLQGVRTAAGTRTTSTQRTSA